MAIITILGLIGLYYFPKKFNLIHLIVHLAVCIFLIISLNGGILENKTILTTKLIESGEK